LKELPLSTGAVIRATEDHEVLSVKAGDLLKLKKNMITAVGQSDIWESPTGCWFRPSDMAGLEFEIVGADG
jgi:hypothetical protein